MDFINNHPRLLECVKHIYEENGSENSIGKFISIGNASGLMYLMAACNTDPVEYLKADVKDDDALDWSRWDKANEFWVLVAQNSKAISPLRKKLGQMLDTDSVSMAERCALIIKAWNCFENNDSITESELELEYFVNDNDIRSLAEQPVIGGIDFAECGFVGRKLGAGASGF